MKVLRVLPELDFGGVESRVELQAALHDRSKYELVVCGFHKDGQAAKGLRSLGVRVDLLNVAPGPRNPRATAALARYLKELEPDVVHASIAEANLHALVAGSLMRSPVLIAEETGMPNHSRVARLVFRQLYRRASAVIGVTQSVCDYIRDVDRAPAHKVRLVYNCASPKYFPDPPDPCERAANGPTNVLLVGRLVPVKNHSFFLNVLERVLPNHPNVSVRIAGDGPLRDELAAAISAHGLSDQVTLLGMRSDIADLLRTAHVFALPSLSEGCSISLIEAMASGTHVIGSNVPGIREVLGPLGDWTASARDLSAWAELLQRSFRLSSQARTDLGSQAQARAYDTFSPHKYVAALEALYRDLLQRAH